MIIKFMSYEIEATTSEILEMLWTADRIEKAAATSTPAPAAPAPAPKTRKADFDTGKARALREAGWTFAKIADEMGVSP